MKAPRLPRYEGGDLPAYLDDLVAQIERALVQTPQGRPYAVSGGTVARNLNVATATAADVAKTLGTLIGDLKAGGSIG